MVRHLVVGGGGGVYYTPDYIVDYIVCEMISRAIEGKTAEEVA